MISTTISAFQACSTPSSAAVSVFSTHPRTAFLTSQDIPTIPYSIIAPFTMTPPSKHHFIHTIEPPILMLCTGSFMSISLPSCYLSY